MFYFIFFFLVNLLNSYQILPTICHRLFAIPNIKLRLAKARAIECLISIQLKSQTDQDNVR